MPDLPILLKFLFDEKSLGNALKSVHGKQNIFFFRDNTSHGIYYICFFHHGLCRREDWASVMRREGQWSVACVLSSVEPGTASIKFF